MQTREEIKEKLKQVEDHMKYSVGGIAHGQKDLTFYRQICYSLIYELIQKRNSRIGAQ